MVPPEYVAEPEPEIESLEEQRDVDDPVTVHFDARPLRAATRLEQESRSVVVRETSSNAPPRDPGDVTVTLRARAGARPGQSGLVAWVEARWVVAAVALAIPLVLLLGVTLLR